MWSSNKAKDLTTRLARAGCMGLPRTLTLAGGVLVSLRPHQWTKNLLVFLPLVFSMGERWSLDELGLLGHLFLRSTLAFLIFCALAGAAYIINDVLDAEQDRLHPRKRRRPIASGLVPLPVAKTVAPVLLAACVAGGFLLDTGVGIVALTFLALNLGYSSFLKHTAILDVMAVSSGYILRVVSGSLTIDVVTSPWLYTTIGLGALFIALGKRYNELRAAGSDAPHRRSVLGQYSLQLLRQLITIAGTSALVAYALYTFSAGNVPENKSMMLTVPFVVFGLFRYLYIIDRTDEGENPEILIVKDLPLAVDIFLWAVMAILVLAFSR